MKRVDGSKWRLYRKRAEAYFATLQLLKQEWQDDPLSPRRESIGLLAVHSAISLADAILIVTVQQRSDDNHAEAASALKKVCDERRRESSGIRHFRALLSRKSDFAYGDKAIRDSELKTAIRDAEQFQLWANQAFAKELT